MAENGATTTLAAGEERVQVAKRVIETARVTVRMRVEERDEPVDVASWEERVETERAPVGRAVEQAPPVRREGDVTIVPVLEERIVTLRQLVLKEELHIRTRREERRERRTVRLRQERIDVERVAVDADPKPGGR